MKRLLYLGLVVGLVPIQTTVLEHLSVAGIRPDLCLIAVSLIGFFGGAADGAMMGLLLGFEQDLFSAGETGINVMTKAAIGFSAGMAGRYVTRATPGSVLALVLGLSALSGVAFLLAGAWGRNALASLQAVLLPQAAFDAIVGTAVYWLLKERFKKDDLPGSGPLASSRRIS